ncbi:hypothetical protein ACA910_004780 [Epithemia clementina (nom. ined.)]
MNAKVNEVLLDDRALIWRLQMELVEARKEAHQAAGRSNKLVVAGDVDATACLKGEIARRQGEIKQAASKLAFLQAECKDKANKLILLHDLLEASNRSLTELKQSKASVNEKLQTREKELLESVSHRIKENANLRQHLTDTRKTLRELLEEKESSSQCLQQSQRNAELRLESISKHD